MAGEQVLVVEDNEKSMKLFRDVLGASGYRTLEATTGRRAVELAAEHRPALVLMDMRLPDVDGHEALRRLRADVRTASTPVLAVTAQAMQGDRERFLAEGFDGYLSKPVDSSSSSRPSGSTAAGMRRTDSPPTPRSDRCIPRLAARTRRAANRGSPSALDGVEVVLLEPERHLLAHHGSLHVGRPEVDPAPDARVDDLLHREREPLEAPRLAGEPAGVDVERDLVRPEELPERGSVAPLTQPWPDGWSGNGGVAERRRRLAGWNSDPRGSARVAGFRPSRLPGSPPAAARSSSGTCRSSS